MRVCIWRNNKGGANLPPPPTRPFTNPDCKSKEEKFHQQISMELGAISLKIFLQFSLFLIWNVTQMIDETTPSPPGA